MRGLSLGLRAKLVVALVAASALTLGVAAVTLLSPLERRLRSDELKSLVRSGSEVRGTIAGLEQFQLRRGSSALNRALRRIASRTGSQALIIDERGRILAATSPQPGDQAVAVRALYREDPVVVLRTQDGAETARVALPAHNERRIFAVELRKTLDVSGPVAVVRTAVLKAALAGLAAALAFGLGFARHLVRRLRQLRTTALRVAQLGLEVEMVPDRTGDEIGDLSRAFGEMQRRLREQEGARRTFVATASHELRTPLTSLRLMLDLLREGVDNGTIDMVEVRDEVDRARGLADRLGGLAAQLLDLSRLDAGVPLRREPIELREATRAVIGEFEARAKNARQSISLEEGGPVWALGDPGALAQIVRVLLDNALRFTPAGSMTVVRVTKGAQGAPSIEVSDTGPGVPWEEREIIFERFRHGSKATTTDTGFGLGLAIARELAEHMDGSLELVDQPVGARFALRLAGHDAAQAG